MPLSFLREPHSTDYELCTVLFSYDCMKQSHCTQYKNMYIENRLRFQKSIFLCCFCLNPNKFLTLLFIHCPPRAVEVPTRVQPQELPHTFQYLLHTFQYLLHTFQYLGYTFPYLLYIFKMPSICLPIPFVCLPIPST